VEVLGILAAVIAALVLYWLGCRRRLYYGMIELVVALTVMVLAFYPQTVGNVLVNGAYTPSALGSLIAKLIPLSAGVYIFVRGLDNIEAGMSAASRSKWKRWF
jgi:hypothetical protein